MSMYYYNGTWYPISTKEGFRDLISDAISPDLLSLIDSDTRIQNSFDKAYYCSDCEPALQLEHAEEMLESLRVNLENKQQQLHSMDLHYTQGSSRLTKACKTKAAVHVQAHDYHRPGEEPYQKFTCPICHASGIHIQPIPPKAGTRFTNCPCCNVRLDWKEALDPEEGGEEEIPKF